MEKYKLHKLYLILGTKCNLRCRHCMGGDPEDMTMDLKIIQRLIDDISFIEELTFGGYEPSLYIPLMYQIVDMFHKKNIVINQLYICHNARTNIDEMIKFIEYAKQYVSSPEKTSLFISDDIFHINDSFTREQLTENIKKYKIANICNIEINDLRRGITIVGRANNLTKEELKKYGCIKLLREKERIPEILCFDTNDEHKITSTLGMTPNGYIYSADIKAFNALATNDYSESMGNIYKKSFSEIITKYKQKIKDVTDFCNVLYIPTELDGVEQELYNTYQIVKIRNECMVAFEKNDKLSFEKSYENLKNIKIDNNNSFYTKAKDIALHYFSVDCNKHELEIIKTISEYFMFCDRKQYNKYQSQIDNILNEHTPMSTEALQAFQAWENWDLQTLQDLDEICVFTYHKNKKEKDILNERGNDTLNDI